MDKALHYAQFYNLLLKLQFYLKHSIQIMFQNIRTYETDLFTIAALFSGAVIQRVSIESCSENFPKIGGKTSAMVFFFSKVTCLTLQVFSCVSCEILDHFSSNAPPEKCFCIMFLNSPLGTLILDFLLA